MKYVVKLWERVRATGDLAPIDALDIEADNTKLARRAAIAEWNKNGYDLRPVDYRFSDSPYHIETTEAL